MGGLMQLVAYGAMDIYVSSPKKFKVNSLIKQCIDVILSNNVEIEKEYVPEDIQELIEKRVNKYGEYGPLGPAKTNSKDNL